MIAYPWSKEEAQIIKACFATDTGRHALTLIVERLGMLHGQSFDKDPITMAFHEGRRFVGRELMAAINNPIETIVQEPHEPRSSRPITATERLERASAGTGKRVGR